MRERTVDLHIHSKYSRACSNQLDLPNIAKACVEKGIDIVSTGDFTHPAWFKDIQELLEEDGSGLLKLKDKLSPTKFVIGTEISCVYKHGGKVRRLHILVFAPSIKSAGAFITALEALGVNLGSDGRPIMGLSGKKIVELCQQIDKRMVVIPAHAWTPWFAVFGSKSGYDSLEECFEELTSNIFAIETGLSSDPSMNRRVSQLDKIALISNSDAHSLEKLGREANVLNFEGEESYDKMWEIIKSGDKNKFLYTIEFYPGEGTYYYDGHSDCKVCMSPSETKEANGICTACEKKLTIGVLHRVEDLADKEEDQISDNFVPHKYIVPLREIIAECFDVGATSKKVENEYRMMLRKFGNEFGILLHANIAEIRAAVSDENIAFGIENMRKGMVKVVPGYDGVYGEVEVFPKGKTLKYSKIDLD
ncbi:MAG: endonuclease Q family protein [Patescibacteria group bacterium]